MIYKIYVIISKIRISYQKIFQYLFESINFNLISGGFRSTI